MINYCKHCGIKIDRVIKFCPKCGCKITSEKEMKEEEKKKTTKRNNNDLFAKIFFIILFLVIILGFYIQNYEKSQNNTEEKNSIVGIPKTENELSLSKSNSILSKVTVKRGIITGDEVILRSKPSTLGSQIVLLYDKNEVEILGKEKCSDNSSAILSIPSLKISLVNGKVITINRGQALIVKRENKGNLICGLNLDGREVSLELPKNNVHLLQGDIWYKVKTENEVVGYVFSDYIKEEN